jgi:hypothetical protein
MVFTHSFLTDNSDRVRIGSSTLSIILGPMIPFAKIRHFATRIARIMRVLAAVLPAASLHK